MTKTRRNFLLNLLRPWFLQSVLLAFALFWNSFQRGKSIMGEPISIFSLILDNALLIWMPVLILIGFCIKHGTKIPNGYIALIIMALSVIISTLYGLTVTSDAGLPFSEVFVLYGLGQGFILSIATVYVYDVVHGIIKNHKKKNN